MLTRVAVRVVPALGSVSLASTPPGSGLVQSKATWPVSAPLDPSAYCTKLAANAMRFPEAS